MSRFAKIFAVSALAVLLTLTGCASFKMRGSFAPDRDVARAFERFEFRDDMNYYSSGSDAYPNALLGLKKEYTLESDLWKKVETAATLKDMVQGMQKKTGEMMLGLHGSRILDNKGNPIGIWYAILSAKGSVVMKDGKRVVVYTPDTDTYLRYDQGKPRDK
ncbi:MAG: hypothetical protein A4E73_00629 [Syntrophaceae bacterium PtaU1.Bin231]|nr:MAG: hypothetical protein A4E73_00629 [Syntrophaceae bacterium PtaU1.Bin231]